MAFGQPFYAYNSTPFNTQNTAYVAPQPQYGNLYGQSQQMAQNANNGVTGQYQQQQQVLPPKTNKILVTSLTDALGRTAEPNTEILYIDQDNPLLYQISIDMQGRKTYRTFEIKDVTEQTQQTANKSVPQIDLSAYAKKEDLQVLKDELMTVASSFAMQSAQSNKPKSVEKTKTEKE